MGVIGCPMYERLRRFPASQADEYRGKKYIQVFCMKLLMEQDNRRNPLETYDKESMTQMSGEN